MSPPLDLQSPVVEGAATVVAATAVTGDMEAGTGAGVMAAVH